jgi:hypothetical protein
MFSSVYSLLFFAVIQMSSAKATQSCSNTSRIPSHCMATKDYEGGIAF